MYRIMAYVGLACCILSVFTGCVVDHRESNVQSFAAGAATALDGKQLYFTFARSDFEEELADSQAKITPAWGVQPYYYRVVSEKPEFIFDPTEHETISFSEADPVELPGSTDPGSFPSNFFGVYVGSDGTISFGVPGLGNADLVAHFSSRQVSVLPIDATVDGARISYATYSDALVVTYENAGGNDLQFIMIPPFESTGEPSGLTNVHGEDIFIVYKSVTEQTRTGVVGISGGNYWGSDPASMAAFFEEFNGYYGGEVDLTKNTDTEGEGLVYLPLP